MHFNKYIASEFTFCLTVYKMICLDIKIKDTQKTNVLYIPYTGAENGT